MRARLVMLAILAACGNSIGNGNGNPDMPDAPKVFQDAPPVVPAMIKVSGVAAEQAQNGSTPLPGVAISLLKRGGDTPLGTATTDAMGKYTMVIATGSQAVDGYLKATKAGYVDTYAYPPASWTADADSVDANMLTTATFGLLVAFGGGNTSKGVITLGVFDASERPVEGATVVSNPASGVYKYSDPSGFPTSTTATAADGHAFMFDVPDGDVTINANKAGMTFSSHIVVARPGKFTTTVIAP